MVATFAKVGLACPLGAALKVVSSHQLDWNIKNRRFEINAFFPVIDLPGCSYSMMDSPATFCFDSCNLIPAPVVLVPHPLMVERVRT